MLNGYIDDEVWFGDEITPDALHGLLYAEGKDHSEDMHIRLNSYGGSCNAAVRMHDDLVAYPGKVTITVSGTAASAATVLCMAADHLEMTPGSLLMIHDPSIVAMGNVRDLKDAIHLLEACKESILNVYGSRIKVTRDQASSMMSKTTWMDANEALEKGFIDYILQAPSAGPTMSAISRSFAEQKVRDWFDRHKVNASLSNHITTKEGVLYEAQPAAPQAAQVAAKAEEPQAPPAPALPAEETPASEQAAEPHDTTEHGTPVGQLQKRLALIMPLEAKNKENNV